MSLALATNAGVRPTAELIAKYDGRASRYTSYPPATQFSAQVGSPQALCAKRRLEVPNMNSDQRRRPLQLIGGSC